jgi:hypothetical protein
MTCSPSRRDDDAQRAVRGRVLGPDVEGHALGLQLDVDAGIGGLPGDVAQLVAVGDDAHRVVTPPPSAASRPVEVGRHGLDVDDARPRLDHARQQREVLAQRVALEVRRQVEVAQVGVAGEADAEHLPRLALVPVGAGVDATQSASRALAVGASGTSTLSVSRLVARELDSAARSWKRVSPPVTPWRIAVSRSGGGSVGSSSPLPKGDGSQSMPRGSRSSRSRCLSASPVRHPGVGAHADPQVVAGLRSASTTASPSASRTSRRAGRRGGRRRRRPVRAGPSRGSSVDDNRIPLPALGHVLVLDALLEQHDALEQRLGRGGQPGT